MPSQKFVFCRVVELRFTQKSYVALLSEILFPGSIDAVIAANEVPRKQPAEPVLAAQLSFLSRRTVMQRFLMSVATSSLALAYAGCVGSEDAADAKDDTVQVAATQQAVTSIGDPLPGTDLDAFAEAKANFMQEEDIHDGLGPVFNENACSKCHGIPAVGGSGDQIEQRYGSIKNGVFFAYDQAPENEGGTLRQLFSNATFVRSEEHTSE